MVVNSIIFHVRWFFRQNAANCAATSFTNRLFETFELNFREFVQGLFSSKARNFQTQVIRVCNTKGLYVSSKSSLKTLKKYDKNVSIGIKLRSLVLQCYGWNGLLCPDYASERKSVWHSWGERGMSRMRVCTYAWRGWCTVQLSWGIYFPILLLNLSINWIPRLYRVWPAFQPFSFLLS